MAKTMKFRNSGKLDLGGKNMEYILAGALIIIIITSVVLALGPVRCGRGPAGPGGKPRVICVECKKEWEIEPKEEREFNREMEMSMGGAPVGRDCDKCGKKKCVFLMTQCPECKEYYLSERFADPEAFADGGHKEICPHCKTDVAKWYKEHRRR